MMATTDARSVIVFGGWDGKHRFNDMHRLDVTTWHWTPFLPASGRAPVCVMQGGLPLGPTSLHCRQSGRLVGCVCSKCDLDSRAAAHAVGGGTQQIEGSVCKLLSQCFLSAVDVVPPARADHAIAKWRYCDDGCWKDLMVCFGGSTDAGVQNDVWLFDFRDRLWVTPTPSSPALTISGA